MAARLSEEQVLALAPDESGAKAALSLTGPGPWSADGAAPDGSCLWGSCAGSGKTPYAVAVDLNGPAYRCSCPSRKFPCKHALALLIRWSRGAVADGEPPTAVAEWLSSRQERAERPPARRSEPPSPEATAKREAARESKVNSGLEELERWLGDQVGTGLAGLIADAHGRCDRMAARLIDAQAPGAAAMVRRIPHALAHEEGRAQAVLASLADLHLLSVAGRRLRELPDGLAATVRARVGWTIPREEVLASPAEVDLWQVLGSRDDTSDRVVSRRVWVRGTTTGAVGMVMAFAPRGQSLDTGLVPGTQVEASMHRYPGDGSLRLAVGEAQQPQPITSLTGGTTQDAAMAYGTVVTSDPWCTEVPAVVRDVTIGSHGGLSDATGRIRLVNGERAIDLLRVVGGGRPVSVGGAMTAEGLLASCVLGDDGLVLV